MEQIAIDINALTVHSLLSMILSDSYLRINTVITTWMDNIEPQTLKDLRSAGQKMYESPYPPATKLKTEMLLRKVVDTKFGNKTEILDYN